MTTIGFVMLMALVAYLTGRWITRTGYARMAERVDGHFRHLVDHERRHQNAADVIGQLDNRVRHLERQWALAFPQPLPAEGPFRSTAAGNGGQGK